MLRQITAAAVTLLVSAAGISAIAAPAGAVAASSPNAVRAGSAQASAAADWAFAGNKRVGVVQWRYPAAATGRPGNAHSGGFFLDNSDGRVWSMWLDWRCPSGVTPPQDSAAQTSCTLLREEVGSAIVFPPEDYQGVGAVGLDIHTTLSTTIQTPTTTTRGSAVLNLTLRPTAAPEQETVYWQDTKREYKRLIVRAPGVIANGSVGWLSLSAPKTTIVSAQLTAYRTYVRPLA
ncbi:MAG: hypothetical protein V9G19_24080 [Tetrasphaera sp.]